MNIEDLKYKLENNSLYDDSLYDNSGNNCLLSMWILKHERCILCKHESIINDMIGFFPCTTNCKMYWEMHDVDKINGCIIGRYDNVK